VKERYELYFNLGLDVLSGKDNWEESLAANSPPHETLSPAAVSPPAPPNGADTDAPPRYKRWKPETDV
jgi:hypothetical protein